MTLSASYVRARQRDAARGRVEDALIAGMPGTVHELADRAGLTWRQAAGYLVNLQGRGRVSRKDRVTVGPRGGRRREAVWSVVES